MGHPVSSTSKHLKLGILNKCNKNAGWWGRVGAGDAQIKSSVQFFTFFTQDKVFRAQSPESCVCVLETRHSRK